MTPVRPPSADGGIAGDGNLHPDRPESPQPPVSPEITALEILAPARLAGFTRLVADAERSDGGPPFSDQSLVEFRSGLRVGLAIMAASHDDDPDSSAASASAFADSGRLAGAAIITADTPAEAELVIDPASRHHGYGGMLLDRVLENSGGRLVIWAHGDHPDARALASTRGLSPVRELLQLRLSPVVATGTPAEVTPFRPGTDDAEWLALNALAFASHAEQGGLTQADLDARKNEPWFDPSDFLIARGADGAMAGFCWLKVEDGLGEFYAVAVSPTSQGTGLGRGLVSAGLARLIGRGIRESNLYVEGDNTPAVALYRSVGFTDHSIDIQYATPGA